jgi:16S rRNA (adenine(1408)-N(1))-methyltransferase
MSESSRRASRPVRRGGVENAIFVVAAAETPPEELVGRADLLTVTFPWGSLLDGVLGRDERVAAGLASLLTPGAELVATLALTDRDGVGSIDDLRAEGPLEIRELRLAMPIEVATTHSTWAKRLRRPEAWRLTMRRRLVTVAR